MQYYLKHKIWRKKSKTRIFTFQNILHLFSFKGNNPNVSCVADRVDPPSCLRKCLQIIFFLMTPFINPDQKWFVWMTPSSQYCITKHNCMRQNYV